MNRVGIGGQGESIWLGWFLLATIANFAPLAEQRGERERAATWRKHATAVTEALERDGWDGEWYRRGYFDDGSPLGSAANSECRIDSIAQSWAVLSGAADPARAAQAMAAVEQYLILPDQRLALLFAPPFDKTPLDPGYIKGYPPGIRENGGQYSHAALWLVQALAKLNQGDKAGQLMALLNPINHAATLEAAQHYRVEPYVVCADIYSVPPHGGRGGWTWYTGSSGWMYRAGLESMLGFYVEGNRLRLAPCIPAGWRSFDVTYRYGAASYKLSVDNSAGAGRSVTALQLDGKELNPGVDHIDLIDDGAVHELRAVLG